VIPPTDVLIVGGGIWGLSAAFHLALKRSASVRLIERHFDVGQETTINAAGQVGQIRSSPVVTRAIAYALDLFERFPKEFGFDPGLHRPGSLFVGTTPERIDYFCRQVALGRSLGLRVDEVAPREMTKLVPGLTTDSILGGYFVHGDGYLDSAAAARALAGAAKTLNADLRVGVRADQLVVDAGRVIGVDTSIGRMTASHVIIAAGPWTAMIAKQVGAHWHVETIRHQRVRTMPTRNLPAGHPVVRLPDFSSYCRPDGDALIYGHFEENPTAIDLADQPAGFSSMDIDPPVELLECVRRRLSAVYPLIGQLEIAEYRRAMITFAPDGAYVIGPVPGIEGLWAASGCAALGIAGSAAVGRWLADWIVDGKPAENLAEFSPTRFAHTDDTSQLRAQALRAYARYYAIPG
jgi:4-methylaminobutanoate oxidase (formaldehyde-forming)